MFALPDGAARIGLDHPHLLRGLSPEEQRFVASLEAAVAGPTPAERRAFAPLLARLQHLPPPWEDVAGALADRSARVVGSSALAIAIAVAISTSGIGQIGIMPASDAAAHARAAAAAAARVAARSSRPLLGLGQHADVTVIVSGGSPNMSHVRAAMAHDRPHLTVVATDRAVRISPVIVPGDVPCALCAALHRRDADADWPLVSAQATTRSGALLAAVPGFAQAAAAGEAARRVVEYCRALAPPERPAGATVPFAADVTPEPVEWHPDCGCREPRAVPPLVGGHELE